MFIRKSRLLEIIIDLDKRLTEAERDASRAFKQINESTYETGGLFSSGARPTIGGTVEAIKKHLGVRVEAKRGVTEVVVIPTKPTELKTAKKGKK